MILVTMLSMLATPRDIGFPGDTTGKAIISIFSGESISSYMKT